MVPKKVLKLAKSLQQKKYRHQERLFLVEGSKSIIELVSSTLNVRTLIGTSVFMNQHKSLVEKSFSGAAVYEASETVISSISSFKHNNAGVALVEMPEKQSTPIAFEGYGLVLDDIRDPGNLGTIIRIADWYGISAIISSSETTDEFNPKVISASMGSFLRIPFYRTDLPSYLENTNLPVYGTLVNRGKSVHRIDFAEQGLIVLGNESRGIQPDMVNYITQAIHIPQFGNAESLNVGIATAVVCDNMRRRLSEKNAAQH